MFSPLFTALFISKNQLCMGPSTHLGGDNKDEVSWGQRSHCLARGAVAQLVDVSLPFVTSQRADSQNCDSENRTFPNVRGEEKMRRNQHRVVGAVTVVGDMQMTIMTSQRVD